MAMLALWWAGDVHRGLVVDFCDSLDKADLYEQDRYWMLLYQLYTSGDIANPYDDKVFETFKQLDVDFLIPRDKFLPKDPTPEAGEGIQEVAA